MLSFLKSALAKTFWPTDGGGFYPVHSGVEAMKSLTRNDYIRLYQSWIYLATSIIADAVAELQWEVRKGKNAVDGHPVGKLVTREFLRQTVSHMLLTGDAYWYKEMVGKKVDSVRFFRSDLTILEENPDGSLKNYRYAHGRGNLVLQPEEVADFAMFSPFETYPYTVKGISPVQAVALQAEIDDVANRWNWVFFKNGATAGSVLQTDQSLSPENKELLLRKWKASFQGVDNAHKVAVLDNGLKHSYVQASKTELDFVNSRRFTRDEILAIFKVPPAVAGITDNANRASATVALETFYRICVSPLASIIAQKITKEFITDGGVFEFVNVVPTDTEQLKTDLMLGAITVNEYRRERGYAPLKNADTLTTGEEAEIAEEKTAFRKTVESVAVNELKKTVPGTPEYLEARESLGLKKWEAKIARTNPIEVKFAKYVSYVFDEQKRDVLASLEETKGKGYKIGKVDKVKWRVLWNGLTGIYKEVMQNEGTLALNEVGVSAIFQTGNPRINKYVKDSVNLLAKTADDYTLERIGAVIKEWNDLWYGAQEIANMISAQFEKYSNQRAQVIARTEITSASTKATVDAWEQSGVVKGKEWYTAPDERVCDHCGAMHRKIIPVSEDFGKNGETLAGLKLGYRDIDWPALHPNCRCTLLPIIE